MRHVLKKSKVLMFLLASVFLGGASSIYAAEQTVEPIKLKRKCLKDYPIVEGQTDQALLSIYQQICEKENAERKNELLVQAALRFYELNQPMTALSISQQLQRQNVKSTRLTDLNFLVGVNLAATSLKNMRENELRFLSEDLTYPPAKALADNIRLSVPAPDTSNAKAITDETVYKSKETYVKPRAAKSSRSAPKRTAKSSAPKPASTTPKTSSPSKPSANPFGSLTN